MQAKDSEENYLVQLGSPMLILSIKAPVCRQMSSEQILATLNALRYEEAKVKLTSEKMVGMKAVPDIRGAIIAALMDHFSVSDHLDEFLLMANTGGKNRCQILGTGPQLFYKARHLFLFRFGRSGA
jgi:hypothetical protein